MLRGAKDHARVILRLRARGDRNAAVSTTLQAYNHNFSFCIKMAHLSEGDRTIILMMRGWGDMQRSYSEVRELFNEEFRGEDNKISKSTVGRTIKHFEDQHNVRNLPKTGRPCTATSDDKALDVMLSFVENPHLSLRRAAQHHNISKDAVHTILKANSIHPYKVNLIHELLQDDYDRRLEFCEQIMARVDATPDFLSNTVFSDEATFMLNGSVNRHNCRYWSSENPHWFMESHTQFPQKVNVWAGIINNTLIGPFFIDGNLTGAKYLTMLQDQIIPGIQNVVGNNFANTWFQQDGAPPHYTLPVRRYLDNVFPGRWIGRRGAIEWPARSPDLAPNDFYLWGYLKSKIYETKPRDIVELSQRITDEARLIPQDQIANAIGDVYFRLAHCQQVDGKCFEHFL